MESKLIRNGVVLGIGINIILFICMYYLEHRVAKLEGAHYEDVCHTHR